MEQLGRSLYIHADETGWKIGLYSRWLWVFSNDDIVIFDVGHRGHEMIEQNLGEKFSGVLICDGFGAYNVIECIKQRCNSHILARMSQLKQIYGEDAPFLPVSKLNQIFKDAAEVHCQQESMSPEEWEKSRKKIKSQLSRWLKKWKPTDAEEKSPLQRELDRLHKHITKHQEEWFLYLSDPDLPTTNNQAERDIRSGVITRKIGGCNKTERGAETTKILTSLLATCRRRGESFIEHCREAIKFREPELLLLKTGKPPP